MLEKIPSQSTYRKNTEEIHEAFSRGLSGAFRFPASILHNYTTKINNISHSMASLDGMEQHT